jgi:hypothetical protein
MESYGLFSVSARKRKLKREGERQVQKEYSKRGTK